MLIHKGAVYRQATVLPTWEEVWELSYGGPNAFENFTTYALVSGLNEEDAKKELRRRYEELRRSLPEEIAGADCYRAIGLDPDICTEDVIRSLDPLGVYWSLQDEKAIPYWGSDEECVVTYRAEVNLPAVDLLSTMSIRLVNPSEDEVRFKKNARIYVYDATILDFSVDEMPEGHIVDIQDWRTI